MAEHVVGICGSSKGIGEHHGDEIWDGTVGATKQRFQSPELYISMVADMPFISCDEAKSHDFLIEMMILSCAI